MDPAETWRAGPDRVYAIEPPEKIEAAQVEALPSQQTSWTALITYVTSLQSTLEQAGFMDVPVPREVRVTDGMKAHVQLGERKRKQRFDQLLERASEKAAQQLSAVAGLPADWEAILARGPRKGTWPRTDWDWVACFEWEVWRQVFAHDRGYESEVAKLSLTWREKAIVRIAGLLEKVTRWETGIRQGK